MNAWTRFFIRLICRTLGGMLFVIGLVYAQVPAKQVPPNFPGHVRGSDHVYVAPGIALAAVGLVLIAAGFFVRRR